MLKPSRLPQKCNDGCTLASTKPRGTPLPGKLLAKRAPLELYAYRPWPWKKPRTVNCTTFFFPVSPDGGGVSLGGGSSSLGGGCVGFDGTGAGGGACLCGSGLGSLPSSG